MDEIDAFVAEHGLGDPRFEDALSEAEMREGLYTRVYNGNAETYAEEG